MEHSQCSSFKSRPARQKFISTDQPGKSERSNQDAPISMGRTFTRLLCREVCDTLN